jgi:hypothetical protein
VVQLTQTYYFYTLFGARWERRLNGFSAMAQLVIQGATLGVDWGKRNRLAEHAKSVETG